MDVLLATVYATLLLGQVPPDGVVVACLSVQVGLKSLSLLSFSLKLQSSGLQLVFQVDRLLVGVLEFLLLRLELDP